MTTKPNNVIQQTQLTTYAFAVLNDAQKILALANLLAPIVPTGTANGTYNTFSDLNSFRAYVNAIRALGGQSNSIGFLSDADTFSAKPFGLRIPIDEQERAQAGASFNLLEQGKVRTLTLACVTSHVQNVVAIAKAAVSASAGVGAFSNANTDPIAELDSQIEAIWQATGMMPNNLLFDFGAWLKLKNNPKVRDRMPGADLATVNPQRLGALLSAPNMNITVSDVAFYANRTDEVANTKKGALAGSALMFYSSQAATQYDASFMKTFSPAASLFTGVYSYEEAPHIEWYENNWTAQAKVVASALCRRIDVS